VSLLVDTSVIVSALRPDDPDFVACCAILERADRCIFVHALNETFATLTGGSLGVRVAPDAAARLICERTAGCRVVTLDAEDVLEAQAQARARGVRGGAIYDYLHLVAARKAGAVALCTLNTSDFLAFHRSGDPEIRRP